MKICKEPGCRKESGGSLCDKHRKRRYRKKYPIMAAYHALKYNAHRRRKEFSLTFEEFALFAIRTQYITSKGKTKDSFSIDRIDNARGYTPDNIRILTLADNTRRRYMDYDWESRIVTYRPAAVCESNTPF